MSCKVIKVYNPINLGKKSPIRSPKIAIEMVMIKFSETVL